MGYAPKDGGALRHHLQRAGFRDDELVKAGLVRESGWDYFQDACSGRSGIRRRSVLGFGARRVFDDDRMPAKYINTPETPVYKKSNVLYGLDLARQPIGKKVQAVVVEGYTDCDGLPPARASTPRSRPWHRLRGGARPDPAATDGNNDALNGEVVFTFDGDAAGQAAALKVFALTRPSSRRPMWRWSRTAGPV